MLIQQGSRVVPSWGVGRLVVGKASWLGGAEKGQGLLLQVCRSAAPVHRVATQTSMYGQQRAPGVLKLPRELQRLPGIVQQSDFAEDRDF